MGQSWLTQTHEAWEQECWGVELPEDGLREQDALGNQELLARAGLEEEPGQSELELDAHLGLWALLACESEELDEPTRQQILQTWGEDTLKAWIEFGARAAWKRHPKLRYLVELPIDALALIDDGKSVRDAALALEQAPAHDPVATIEAIARFLDLTGSLCPHPSIALFLRCTGLVIEQIAGAAERLVQRGLRMNEEFGGPLYTQVLPDGGYLVRHLRRIQQEGRPVPPTTALSDHVAERAEELGRLVGEPPPVSKRSLLGSDLLAPDQRDDEALAAWLYRHFDALWAFFVDPLYPSIN